MRKIRSTGKSCAHGTECMGNTGPVVSRSRQSGPLGRLNWSYDRVPLSAPDSATPERKGTVQRAAGVLSHSADSSLFFNLIATGTPTDLPSGYGFTKCDFPGGASSTVTTSGCNRPCTELHEKVHLADIKPCCNQANMEYLLSVSPEAKERVKATWGRWANTIRPVTECRAYDVSVPCLQKTLKEKKCDRASMTAEEKECCGEIKLALDDDIAGQNLYSCEKTSRVMPPCPFGPSGPQATTQLPNPATEGPDNSLPAQGVDSTTEGQNGEVMAQAVFGRRTKNL
jgi:hypothetical protein